MNNNENAKKWIQDIEDKHPTDSDAQKFRRLCVKEILFLFEEDNGHPTRSPEETEAWLSTPRGQAIINIKAQFARKRYS